MAVPEYAQNHHDAFTRDVREAMEKLDGSRESQLAVLTGLRPQALDDLGGVPAPFSRKRALGQEHQADGVSPG